MGEVFFDDRGEERALRLSCHTDAAVMVLSIWNQGVCSGTFRLMSRDVPAFIEALTQAVPPPAEPRGRRRAPDDRGAYGESGYPEPVYEDPGPATEAYTPSFVATGPYVTTGQYSTDGLPPQYPPAPSRPPAPAPAAAPAADPLEVLKSLGTTQQTPGSRYPRTGEYRAPNREY